MSDLTLKETIQCCKYITEGIDDIDGISRKTGAVSGCGSCEWDIADFLAEHVK